MTNKNFKMSEEEALQNFVLDTDLLTELSEKVSEFNIFEALGVVRSEIRHSSFLCSLMDPHIKHGLGLSFFEAFFKAVLKSPQFDNPKLNLFDFCLNSYDDIAIYKERLRIDIMAVSEKHRTVFVIENKIDSGEGKNQLIRYIKDIKNEYPGYCHVYCYLTIDGDEPSDPRWIAMSYRQVVDILESIKDKNQSSINPPAKFMIEHYIEIFRRSILENSDNAIQKLAVRIYNKHKKAIDTIVENIPDDLSIRSENIKTYIEDKYCTNGTGIEFDSGSRCYIRFAYKPWDEEPKTRHGGWGKNNRMIMIELRQENNGKSEIVLFLAPVANASEEVKNFRERIFSAAKVGKLNGCAARIMNNHTRLAGLLLYNTSDRDSEESEILYEKMEEGVDKFFREEWPKILDILNPVILGSN